MVQGSASWCGLVQDGSVWQKVVQFVHFVASWCTVVQGDETWCTLVHVAGRCGISWRS